MPGGDRTGPMGQGPMTGRGAGFCRGSRVPGYTTSGGGFFGGWFGRGRGGGGRGWRNCFFATGLPGWMRFGAAGASASDAETEARMLQSEAASLSERLDAIKQRLDDLLGRSE